MSDVRYRKPIVTPRPPGKPAHGPGHRVGAWTPAKARNRKKGR